MKSTSDIAKKLELFLSDSTELDPYFWDDFECVPFDNPVLERWRKHILSEIGQLVAPMPEGFETLLKERSDRIISSLKSANPTPD